MYSTLKNFGASSPPLLLCLWHPRDFSAIAYTISVDGEKKFISEGDAKDRKEKKNTKSDIFSILNSSRTFIHNLEVSVMLFLTRMKFAKILT